MVVFTCNNCGESLQKPKVEKHFATVCRKAKSLTCVDCFKDFLNEDYMAHTKCVTEEERYAAKGSFTQPLLKKGEIKQQSWTEIIQFIVKNNPNVNSKKQEIFQLIMSSVNVPRKKNKFINFVKSAMGNRIYDHDIETVWDIIEKQKQENGTGKTVVTTDGHVNGQKENVEIFDSKDKEAYLLKNNAGNKEIIKKKKLKKSTEPVELTINNQNIKKNRTDKKSKTEQTLLCEENEKNLAHSDKVPKESNVEYQKRPIDGEIVKTTVIGELKESKKLKKKRLSEHESIPKDDTGEKITDENCTDIPKRKKESEQIPENEKPRKRAKTNLESDVITTKKNKRKLSLQPIVLEEHGLSERKKLNTDINRFSYKKEILDIMKEKKSISIKKLEKKVCKEYQKAMGVEPSSNVIKKFNKRLKKMEGIQLDNDNVILSVKI